MRSDTPAIQLEQLSKSFGRGDRRIEAVRDLSLSIAPRQVFGFLGPNGAGKTTTIRLLMDLIRPSLGTARLFGKDVSRHPAVLKSVGALVEDAKFYGHLSARDNLRILAYTASDSQAENIDRLLEKLGLAEAATRRFSDFSTGMKQRLGIAAALLSDPDLVILDEPTNGLDPAGIVEIRKFIRALTDEQGKTVFLSSHLLTEVEQVCDRVAIINHGSIIKQGTVNELLSEGASELRIEARPAEQAAEALRPRWEVVIHGDWLSIITDQAQAPEIVRALVAGQVEVLQVVARQQSLEEYFMSVTGSEARSGSAEEESAAQA